MPRGRTRAAGQPAPALLDFRPVLKNRKTLPYIIGYSAHNYELFGQRSWMVAFLVFTASLQPADAPMLIGAATLAATINMLGPVMSVSGNELAIRFGRTRVIFTFMTASGLLACVLGYTAALPWMLVFLIMCLHYGLMLGDSAALTSGAIASAPPDDARRDDGGLFLRGLQLGVPGAADLRRRARPRGRQPQPGRVGARVRQHRHLRRALAARALALPAAPRA